MNPDITDWVEFGSSVARSSKIMFVATPKVACTTIREALVALEDAGRTGRPQAHDLSTHSTPKLRDIPIGEAEIVMSSPDWIRFCVTRRPYERLVSAWMNKIFAGWVSERTLPYAEATHRTRDVGAVFRDFVRGLDKDFPLYRDDEHFVPQATLLQAGQTPYTHVLDVSELESFAAWLRSSDPSRQGFDVSGRRNQSLKVPLRSMYDIATAKIVEELYAEDFESFGYQRDVFGEKAEEFLISENELVLVERLSTVEAEALLARPMVRLAERRTGGRYGLQEVLRSIRKRLRKAL